MKITEYRRINSAMRSITHYRWVKVGHSGFASVPGSFRAPLSALVDVPRGSLSHELLNYSLYLVLDTRL